MFEIVKSVLVLVDIQGKLAEAMYAKETLLINLERMINSALSLEIPILWVEQIPEKMGPTVERVASLLPDRVPISKTAFSCYGEQRFVEQLNLLGKTQIIVTGIEAHVCVYQTAMDLVDAGYEVQVVADAVSSRTLENKQIALARMAAGGVQITSAEMILFELLKDSTHPRFRAVSRHIK